MKTLLLPLVGFLTFIVPVVGAFAESTLELLSAAQTAYMKGDLDTAKKNFQAVAKAEPKNQVAAGYLRKIALDQAKQPAPNTTKQQLEKLMLPKVDFKEATFSSVLDFLKNAATKNSDGKVNVSFVVNPDVQSAQTVTLALANVPYSEVLRYLGELAKVEFVYDKYAIVVRPKGGAATAETAPVSTPQ